MHHKICVRLPSVPRKVFNLSHQRPHFLPPGLPSTINTITQVLNLSYTAVGDATLEALTFGRRARAWAAQHAVAQPPEAAAWPE